ncbi:MAG: 3-deoxy-7-phosphoheptulonate synthase [Candidatus Azotimanducaceae bacterium]|jgi:3-deoxy-7-phosphoheptulonate synthase
MNTQVEDTHITKIRPLITPAVLIEEFTPRQSSLNLVENTRRTIENILEDRDKKMVVIVGPCSIHDPIAAIEYAKALKMQTESFENLLIVMRVYFEKPRTVVGWKGLINDPDIDNSFNINKGLRLARKLLLDISEIGLPCGTEFLDTTFGQYYADLISWGAIGARTAESQIHRELASGLSMPVGIKNRTDGNLQVAVDGIRAAAHRHLFPSLTKEGAPAIFETGGNQYCHLILRGGDQSGPNFDDKSMEEAVTLLQAHELKASLIVDCSHGNSQKDPRMQIKVIDSLCESIKGGQKAVKGVMIESHLKAGRQNYDPDNVEYGLSITDGCLSLAETIPLLEKLNSLGALSP